MIRDDPVNRVFRSRPLQDDNFARVKSNKWASDDDAADLLSGILDETEDDALLEQQRIEAELQAKEESERMAREAEEQRKRADAEAKLSAELDRLEQVAERRTQKIEALKIEELKERGEWIDPEVERAKVEAQRREQAEAEAMKIAAQAQAQQMISAPMTMPNAQKKSPIGLIAIIAVLVLSLAGVAGGFAYTTRYQVDNTTYAKSVFNPASNKVAMIEMGFTPVPKKKAVVVVDEAPKAKSSRKSSKSSRKGRTASKSTTKTKKTKISSNPKKNAAAKKLDDMLSKDIFSTD